MAILYNKTKYEDIRRIVLQEVISVLEQYMARVVNIVEGGGRGRRENRDVILAGSRIQSFISIFRVCAQLATRGKFRGNIETLDYRRPEVCALKYLFVEIIFHR